MAIMVRSFVKNIQSEQHWGRAASRYATKYKSSGQMRARRPKPLRISGLPEISRHDLNSTNQRN